jgi:hypothetical protein
MAVASRLLLLLLLSPLLLVLLQATAASTYKPSLSPYKPPKWQRGNSLNDQPDLVSRCTLLWRNATLDHFTWVRERVIRTRCRKQYARACCNQADVGFAAALLQREPEDGISTFQQRVFICDEFWKPAPNKALGPIFFYLGNEADVTL